MPRFLLLVFACASLLATIPARPAAAQAVPSPVENIDYIVTFGAQADKSWGDDDFTQTFFFLVPKARREPLYIRVFDPDCGGKLDEAKFGWNTQTAFSLYGGAGAHSGPDARSTEPRGNFRSGTLLKTQTFGAEAAYDGKWFTFGPLNPLEGELVPEFDGYVFKLVAQGLKGDDGNLYRYFLSSSPTQNVAVEGGNAFTYEYSFRLASKPGAKTHLYPFVNNRVVSIKQSNFDLDDDATITIFSVAKNGHPAAVSGDEQWRSSTHPISEKEHGLSVDLQLVNRSKVSNDLVFYVTDQYDTALPFFAVPLGGPPKYRYEVDVKIRK
ncbi:hypothetical protein F0P96_06500 [Hymenobacter busanensis]|uniref:Uncharacterized protein n=1 Tax=Hymenobacter busanensis TaxID=2607656 RepID=A0A7L5A1L5_9BACT|nr:hypothetical protein [Hymenobacter busanensis]KAA9338479.1 hypothetical protein F0P96_06500 [Hymenobacter busanensis]QHJ09093.1 hypothetical protein GUY19_18100 [Hymenobacter busanensis]